MHILTWQSVAMVAAFCTTLGMFLDKILLHRQKQNIHLALTRWWDKLDDTTVPDIPRLMAQWTLQYVLRFAYAPLPIYTKLLITLVISWFLTTFASLFADILEGMPLLTSDTSSVQVPIFTVYAVNALFDSLTIVVTLYALYLIISKPYWFGVVAILCDIMVAALITILCYASLLYADNIAYSMELPGSWTALEHSRQSLLDKQRSCVYGVLLGLMKQQDQLDEFFGGGLELTHDYDWMRWKGIIKYPLDIDSKSITDATVVQQQHLHNNSKRIDDMERSLKKKLGYNAEEMCNNLLAHASFRFYDDYFDWARLLKDLRGEIAYRYEDYIFNIEDEQWSRRLGGAKEIVVTIAVPTKSYLRFPFMALTTFVPTAIYLIVLIVIICGKAVLTVSKSISMHYLEVITENDPERGPQNFIPGTMIGALFGVIAALAKVVTTIMK